MNEQEDKKKSFRVILQYPPRWKNLANSNTVLYVLITFFKRSSPECPVITEVIRLSAEINSIVAPLKYCLVRKNSSAKLPIKQQIFIKLHADCKPL